MKLTFLVFVNSLLYGLPDKEISQPQHIQNLAAWLFTKVQFGGWSRNWQIVSIDLRVEDSDLKRLLTWVDIAKH